MAPRNTRLTSFAPPGQREEDVPDALGVTDLVTRANGVLKGSLSGLWVRGEISGLKRYDSGHWYFDLKDENASVSCVMWKSHVPRVAFEPQDGDEVFLRGDMGVYSKNGRMQFYATAMRKAGVGELQRRFEELKARLQEEGLFDEARKRAVPVHPRVVGVVTSRQGAVIRDIVRTAGRRNPALRLVFVDARVQGEGSVESIVRGIEALDANGGCDVIIVARGGGSLEDLWSFNEEPVVRAVVASRTPVISAVGHESDFTLCDFAADLRASTPTAAAECVAPDALALLEGIDACEQRLLAALERLVPDLRQEVDEQSERAARALRQRLGRDGEVLAQKAARLDNLSPLNTLARGYAVVRREGRVVRARADAPEGSDVDIILKDGRVAARITKNPQEDTA